MRTGAGVCWRTRRWGWVVAAAAAAVVVIVGTAVAVVVVAVAADNAVIIVVAVDATDVNVSLFPRMTTRRWMKLTP